MGNPMKQTGIPGRTRTGFREDTKHRSGDQPIIGSVVYDNLVSSDDTIQAKNTQALGGGSVIIHNGK
jgi:hypothetical protein